MGGPRVPAVGLGVVYVIAIGLLGPLLGSTADSTAAYQDHFTSDANIAVDLVASLLLLVAAALLVWTLVVIRDITKPNDQLRRLRELVGASGLISAAGIVVASGLLATVPLTTAIGNITDDPGIDPPVQAGLAQAGTVVLLAAMIAVGATVALVAHIGRAYGAIALWVVVAAWVVAAALLLGVTIALLFPVGLWWIALGLTWRQPPMRHHDQP